MAAKPIELGGLHFKKQADAIAHLKNILYKYDLGDRINSEDTIILRAALNGHPDAEKKIGAGVMSFSVRSADFGTRCFWVNRVDGTTEKFSFRSCITG